MNEATVGGSRIQTTVSPAINSDGSRAGVPQFKQRAVAPVIGSAHRRRWREDDWETGIHYRDVIPSTARGTGSYLLCSGRFQCSNSGGSSKSGM
jgi:hypothetical protein